MDLRGYSGGKAASVTFRIFLRSADLRHKDARSALPTKCSCSNRGFVPNPDLHHEKKTAIRLSFFMVDLRGIVCVFADGKNKGSHQSPDWWLEQRTALFRFELSIPLSHSNYINRGYAYGVSSVYMVDLRGIEPLTSRLRTLRSPSRYGFCSAADSENPCVFKCFRDSLF